MPDLTAQVVDLASRRLQARAEDALSGADGNWRNDGTGRTPDVKGAFVATLRRTTVTADRPGRVRAVTPTGSHGSTWSYLGYDALTAAAHRLALPNFTVTRYDEYTSILIFTV